LPVPVIRRYALKGKRSALVRTPSGDLIPVERKKTCAPRRGPYDGDQIRATAYCILVDEESGRTPPFMHIQHADRWFDVPYTPERKRWVLEMSVPLWQVRRAVANCHRSHRIAAKYGNCDQNASCGEAL
jgi:hypothetical protein